MSNDKIIAKYFPAFKDVGFFFKNYLEQYINNDTTILEIGCGRQSFGHEYYMKAKHRTGIDPDSEALKDNTLMDEKICCSIQTIPDTIGQFDIVIAQWVLEHIQNPTKDMEKISSLCKSGGHFIFMTTNIYSPIMLVSKLLPTGLKKFLRKTLLNINENDTYPTPYKINSPSAIDKYLTKAGFKKVEIKTVGVLTYYSWNKYLLISKIFFDRTIGKIIPVKTHIVGVYKKI